MSWMFRIEVLYFRYFGKGFIVRIGMNILMDFFINVVDTVIINLIDNFCIVCFIEFIEYRVLCYYFFI